MLNNSRLLSSLPLVLGAKQRVHLPNHPPHPPLVDMMGTHSPLLRMADIFRNIFYAVVSFCRINGPLGGQKWQPQVSASTAGYKKSIIRPSA